MREETFLEFIKKARLPFVLTRPLNIGYVIVVSLLIYHGIETYGGIPLMGSFIITIGFLGQKLLLYGMQFKVYRAGRGVIKELGFSNVVVLENISVYVRNFDILDLRKFLPLNLNKIIYDFEIADIVLTENSVIFLGKSHRFGGLAYGSPIELKT